MVKKILPVVLQLWLVINTNADAGGIYNPTGFSNFWESSESPITTRLKNETQPARIQGIILTYLRSNPSGFLAIIPSVKDTQTWEAAGAFSRTILELSEEFSVDLQQAEMQLIKNAPKELTGAVVAAMLQSSKNQESTALIILIHTNNRIDALNEMVHNISWPELRLYIEKARSLLSGEEKKTYEAEILAWH